MFEITLFFVFFSSILCIRLPDIVVNEFGKSGSKTPSVQDHTNRNIQLTRL